MFKAFSRVPWCTARSLVIPLVNDILGAGHDHVWVQKRMRDDVS